MWDLSVPAQLYSALEVFPWHNARVLPQSNALVPWMLPSALGTAREGALLHPTKRLLEINWVNQATFYQFKQT